MWTVTPRFLQAIPTPHEVISRVTCTPPGGAAVGLQLTAGTWNVSTGQQIRRTASLTVEGGSAAYQMLSTPGAVVQVEHGIRWTGTERELVPIITGELSNAATRHGDGTIDFSIADFGQRVAASNYLAAFTPTATTTRRDVLTSAVTSAVPCTVSSTVEDFGLVGVDASWTSRAQLITDLSTDGQVEAFFQPDGSYLIRPVPQITDPAVWLLKTGPGGTIESFARNRPLDRLYNTVVVLPAGTDGTQTWTSVVAQISDPDDPRHPDRIGVRPLEWTSPTVLTTAEAAKVAASLLARVQGSTETLTLGFIANPALDAGDVVRITEPTDDGITMTTHIIDSLSGDLLTGSMTCQTRALAELPS